MPTNHDAVAAIPISGNTNKTLLRNVVTARMPYVLADSDTVTDLEAVDPDTGSAIIDIIFLGRLFHYDPTDLSTANDGVSCLVTFEGRRYKLSDGSDVFAYSVLDNSLTAPPVSPGPVIGDAYLIAAGATGAWAGKANYIGVYTRRGWEFINFGIGRFIYVESVDTYYHRNSGGSWVSGFGNQTFGPNSVPLSAAINFGKRLIVENQTTNAPPGSPSTGDTYIIGASPTGSWAGKAAKIAVCEDGSTFTIYTPTSGWAAYDKAKSAEFFFNGSAWVSAAGAFVATQTTVNNSWDGYSNVIPVDDTIPQITEGQQAITTSYTPKSATNKLRVTFKGNVSGGGAMHAVGALFLNSNANAIKATAVFISAASDISPMTIVHEFVPGVTSAITLSVRLGTSNISFSAFLNGTATGRSFGGVDSATLIIDEIVA